MGRSRWMALAGILTVTAITAGCAKGTPEAPPDRLVAAGSGWAMTARADSGEDSGEPGDAVCTSLEVVGVEETTSACNRLPGPAKTFDVYSCRIYPGMEPGNARL